MKLILRADVENLGNLGDVVTVKPGYGRNFLLPQGLAMVASEANMKAFELERSSRNAWMPCALTPRPCAPSWKLWKSSSPCTWATTTSCTAP